MKLCVCCEPVELSRFAMQRLLEVSSYVARDSVMARVYCSRGSGEAQGSPEAGLDQDLPSASSFLEDVENLTTSNAHWQLLHVE